MISEREEILKALRAVPVVLGRLVRGLPDGALRARPADGEWAIIEVVAHMADTEERSLARTRRMLSRTPPRSNRTTRPGWPSIVTTYRWISASSWRASPTCVANS